jgi:hypothetical protein
MVGAAMPSAERSTLERRPSVRPWVALWVAASVVRWARVSEEGWAVEGVAE